MPKKKKQPKRFSDLTWDDIEEWAGGKIVSRGRNYQQQGRVSDLAVTDDGSLIAWVSGTRRYATRVTMDEDGLPDSTCTCPYELDCKHGVAVVLEYLEWVENNRPVPKVKQDDDRLGLLEDDHWDDETDEDEAAKYLRKDAKVMLREKKLAEWEDYLKALREEHIRKRRLIEILDGLEGKPIVKKRR